MQFELIISENCQEKVVVYAKERTALISEIEKLLNETDTELNGYIDREVVRLNISQIYCFVVENNKVFAVTHKDKFMVKARLYQLEEKYGETFVKINQSCMVNIKQIAKFDVSFTGTLNVRMKNGYNDYVSRRNIKKVKERLGL